MARNDGVDRTSVRNLAVSDKAVGNTQQHNEREKDSYRNPDIIPQRAAWNVHFKKPTASYTDLFAQLEAAGTMRHTASVTAMAAISPPVRTKSPREISSSTHSSINLWSMPS